MILTSNSLNALNLSDWWQKENASEKIKMAFQFFDAENEKKRITQEDVQKALNECNENLVKYVSENNEISKVIDGSNFFSDIIREHVKELAIYMALLECARADAMAASDGVDFGDFYDELKDRTISKFLGLIKNE